MSPEDRLKEIVAGKSSAGMIDGEVYRTDDAGATWKKVSPEKQSIGGAPGYYYRDIIVDPNDDKHVYVLPSASRNPRTAARPGTRPSASAATTTPCGSIPADSNHMLLGYDHGMGVTFDGGQELVPSRLSAPGPILRRRFRHVLSLPRRRRAPGQRLAVMGARARRRRSGPRRSASKTGTTVGGGDGMYNVFDRKTNRYLYNESQFGPLARIDLVTGERKSIAYQAAEARDALELERADPRLGP